MRKLYSLFWVRGKILASYVRRAPYLKAVWPWLCAGLVQTRMLKGEKVGRVLVSLGKGKDQKVWLDLGSAQQRDTFQEVLVERNYPLGKVPFKPNLIVDCGANVGYFSSLAHVWFPEARLVAWEANAENFAVLRAQPALQGAKIELQQAAVSEREGEGFFIGEGVGGRLEIGSPSAVSETVKVIDLGSWWKKNATSRTVWKIDVEGHENILLPRLKHSWLKPCVLFLETHEKGGKDETILNGLKEDGFKTILIKEHSLTEDPRVFKEYICNKD